MRTRDQSGRSTAAGLAWVALRSAEQFVDAEDANARPVLLTMYGRRVEANMAAALELLERHGLALGWLSARSPCQGAADLTGYVIASGERTPWRERVAASGRIEEGQGCAAARRFSTR